MNNMRAKIWSAQKLPDVLKESKLLSDICYHICSCVNKCDLLGDLY